MKYILVIGDGMADNPLRALNGKTPLEAAHKPHMDAMATAGVLGTVHNVPEGFPPGSDTAILSIFGCAPEQYYSGRAPLEAAAQGIALEDGDAAFRCNNVCLSDEPFFMDKRILSHSAGGIGGDEGRELVEWLFAQPRFRALAARAGMEIFPTDSYRHIAVQRHTDIRGLRLSPPHDHLGESVSDNLPAGCPDAEILAGLLELASSLLEDHPINQRRRAEGKMPANGIWFWAEGTAASLPDFAQRYGHTGAVISAVPLCHGIAKLCGLEVVHVPGATGEVDTNYDGKVRAALQALQRHDFVAVHLEGPDECTHCGDLPGKITAIERLDALVVGPIAQELRRKGERFRMLILSDHKTLMEGNGAHDGDGVPFLLYDSRDTCGGIRERYTEACGLRGLELPAGTELMPLLFQI